MSNIPIGGYTQKLEKTAERRVYEIARTMGFDAHYATREEDARKVNLIINKQEFQVSATGKSLGSLKRLRNLGIWHIVAGEQVSNDDIRFSLEQILRKI